MVGLFSFDSMGTGRVLPSTEAQYGTVCVGNYHPQGRNPQPIEYGSWWMNASSHLSSIDESKKCSIHSSESPQRDQAPVAHRSDLDNTPCFGFTSSPVSLSSVSHC